MRNRISRFADTNDPAPHDCAKIRTCCSPDLINAIAFATRARHFPVQIFQILYKIHASKHIFFLNYRQSRAFHISRAVKISSAHLARVIARHIITSARSSRFHGPRRTTFLLAKFAIALTSGKSSRRNALSAPFRKIARVLVDYHRWRALVNRQHVRRSSAEITGRVPRVMTRRGNKCKDCLRDSGHA